MSGKHHIFDWLIAIFFRYFPNRKEVVQGFAHLLVVHIDVAIMHPVAGIRLTGAALGLSNFIFMVREDQVLTAAVQVDGLAQMFMDHRGAFNVPAGTAFAPAGAPGRFTGFCRFPQCKVKRIFFLLVDIDSCAAFQLLNGLVGQLAIFIKFTGAEIYIAANMVGITLIFQLFHDPNNVVHGFGCFWMNICLTNT